MRRSAPTVLRIFRWAHAIAVLMTGLAGRHRFRRNGAFVRRVRSAAGTRLRNRYRTVHEAKFDVRHGGLLSKGAPPWTGRVCQVIFGFGYVFVRPETRRLRPQQRRSPSHGENRGSSPLGTPAISMTYLPCSGRGEACTEILRNRCSRTSVHVGGRTRRGYRTLPLRPRGRESRAATKAQRLRSLLQAAPPSAVSSVMAGVAGLMRPHQPP